MLAAYLNPARMGRIEPAEALRARERIGELIAEHSFSDVETQLLGSEAFEALYSWRFDKARLLLRQAHERFARTGDDTQAAGALSYCVDAATFLGELGEAKGVVREAAAFADDHGLRGWNEVCLCQLAVVALVQGDVDAFEKFLKAPVTTEEVAVLAAAVRASRLEMGGDLSGALALLEGVPERTNDLDYRPAVHAVRARILLNAGREREAGEERRRFLEFVRERELGPTFNGITFTWSLAALDEAIFDPPDPSLLAAVLQLSRHLDAEGLPAWVEYVSARCTQRVFASVELASGLLDEAEARFQRALEWCEREQCPIEAGRCLQGLAEIAQQRGDEAAAMAYLDRAGALFSQYGAKLYLDRILAKKQILKA